jgi:hypothetical protein
MRDDRYRGTSLSRPVRKLCRMSEREADRARPDRLREQAVAAFVSEASREISPEFRKRLRDHDATPTLFSARELGKLARLGLEAVVASNVGNGADPTGAICDALRQRGEGYVREQKCQLIADRHPSATSASESVRKAFDEGSPVAARLILAGQSVAKTGNRVQLTENLLGLSVGGGVL